MGASLVRDCFKPPLGDKLGQGYYRPNLSLDTGTQAKETSQVKRLKDLKGRKIINQYIIQKNIRRKPFWKVCLASSAQDKQYYVMKIFNKTLLAKKKMGKRRSLLEEVWQEVNIQRQLHHPNIVRMVEILDDPTQNRLYVVLEYMSKGSLENLILKDGKFSPITEVKARHYFIDILLGLEYLHQVHVIHRDIKPENLLLDNYDRVKISDFGTAVLIENDNDERLKASVGSPAFMPPELCATDSFPIIGPALDLWSLGVTLYLLIFGRLPFHDESKLVLFEKIRGQELIFPDHVDANLQDVFKQLLCKDPRKRITLALLKQHPWLSQR